MAKSTASYCGLFEALASSAPAGQVVGEKGEVGMASGGAAGRGGGAAVTAMQCEFGELFEARLTDLFERCVRDLPATSQHALVALVLEALDELKGDDGTSSSLAYAEACSLVFRFLGNLRDVRGGKGERLLAYRMLVQLHEALPEITMQILPLLVKDFGSFGDLHRIHLLLQDMSPVSSSLSAACEEAFVTQLAADLSLPANASVSLCGKHAPREKKGATTKHAKHANAMAGAIAVKLFLRNVAEEDQHKHLNAAIGAEKCLKVGAKRHARREYRLACSQLAKRAKVVEQPMCSGAWDTIFPANVPACAAKKYRAAFQNRVVNSRGDEERSSDPRRILCAERFADAISTAIATGTGIKGAVAGAHGICKPYVTRGGGGGGSHLEVQPMLEAQWANLIKEAKASGALPPCLALCDVSGSMQGVPMEVCVALGLVVAELAPERFKDHVLTFESRPQFHKIQGDTLAARVANLMSAPWGGSTDFAAAMNLILQRAVSQGLAQDQMPELLFVFSDMQFDVANCSSRGTSFYRSGARDAKSGWSHAWANIQRAYKEAGYVTPHLVFWNLRGKCTTKPCETISEGCSTMSGYSDAMLKAFMGGKLCDMLRETPWDRVRAVLGDERYDIVDKLVMAHFGETATAATLGTGSVDTEI